MCFASLAGDTDSDHQLSFGELQAAMASLGLDLTDTHDTAAHDTTHENHVRAFRELWTQIDVTGRGTVSYEELLEALAPTKLILIPKGRGQHVAGAAIRERMRTGVNGSMRTAVTQLHDAFAEIATDRVIDVFRAWDTDGSGCLSRREFAKAMATLDVRATKRELHALFNKLDPDNSGTIELKELAREIQKRRVVNNEIPNIY